ncbi:MAG: DUF6541 family protein [Actinomycetota bacterium]|jgi:hypothetical protein
MEAVLWPVVGLLLVGFLPGLLVERILLPRRSIVDRLASAPALSCAVVYLFFRILGFASVPVSPGAFFILLVMLIGLAFGPRGMRRPAPMELEPKRGLEVSIALGLLIMAIALGAGVWLTSIPREFAVPPNHDSMYHGFMAARISETGSLEADQVLVTSVHSDQPVTAFYPLGLHVVAALVHQVTGTSLSDILWWIVVVAGALCLPVGIFSLTRRFFPDDPLSPGVAALLSVLIPLFPYKPIAWGGIALIMGMALTPGVVGVLEASVGASWSVAALVLAVIALVGVLVVHTSEVPLVVLLVGTLVLHQAPGRHWWPFIRTRAARLAMIGGVFGLLALPLAGRAMEDRSSYPDNPTIPVENALVELARLRVAVDTDQGRIALLAASGIAVLLWRRRPWLALAFGCVVALYAIAASSTNQLLRLLVSPWYRQSERVAYVVAFMAAIVGSLAVASLAGVVAHRYPGRPGRWLAIGAASVVMLVVAANIPPRTSAMLRRQIDGYSAVRADELAAFRFVREQRTPLAVLGDELGDGSIWMYSLTGVAPVFGMRPPAESRLFKSWSERLFVARHLNDATARQEVDFLLAKYCVGFVYYSDRRLYGAETMLNLEALKTDTRFQEAFRSGTAHVFRLKEPACAQPGRVRRGHH